MKRMAAALIIGGALTLSGASVAMAYPPSDTTPNTEVSPEQDSSGPTSVPTLPSTGSDATMSALLIGGGLLGSGALLVGGVRRRRA